MKSPITVLIFAWLIFTALSANAVFFNFSLWDLFKAAVTPKEDHRTSLEKAVDLPEDTLQKRNKHINLVNLGSGLQSYIEYKSMILPTNCRLFWCVFYDSWKSCQGWQGLIEV